MELLAQQGDGSGVLDGLAGAAGGLSGLMILFWIACSVLVPIIFFCMVFAQRAASHAKYCGKELQYLRKRLNHHLARLESRQPPEVD